MRRSLIQLTTFILLNCVPSIDVQHLVGVHRNDHFSNECVDASFLKSAQKQEQKVGGMGSFLIIYYQTGLNVPETVSDLIIHQFSVYF